eukprot:3324019-Pyramimonas_sp.AAC.1
MLQGAAWRAVRRHCDQGRRRQEEEEEEEEEAPRTPCRTSVWSPMTAAGWAWPTLRPTGATT